MKKILLLLLLSISPSVFASISSGATVADIAESIGSQIDTVPDLMAAMSYIFGIVLGIKAILKLKEHSESKGQVKISIPIVMAIASALFLALPKALSVGQETMGYNKSEDKSINWSSTKGSY